MGKRPVRIVNRNKDKHKRIDSPPKKGTEEENSNVRENNKSVKVAEQKKKATLICTQHTHTTHTLSASTYIQKKGGKDVKEEDVRNKGDNNKNRSNNKYYLNEAHFIDLYTML